MNIAIYPGSFDPFTNGHLDILKRALKVFDEVIVLVAVNASKKTVFTLQERVDAIQKIIADLPGARVDSWEGLTVDYAEKAGARHLIRGLRAVTDFEYEFQMASANHFANPNIDEVFLMANVEHSFISSSVVNELRRNGSDVSALVPEPILEAYKAKGI